MPVAEFAPAPRLSVPTIAQRLNVSRSPVREAVQRLVQDDRAVVKACCGAAVATLIRTEIGPLREIRGVPERFATRLAAVRRSQNEFAQLAALVEEHRQAVGRGDIEAHPTFGMRFHALLRQITGNQPLAEVMDKVQNKIALGMLSADAQSWPKKAVIKPARVRRNLLAGG